MNPRTGHQDHKGISWVTVGFISLGCAKNLVDSEYMATSLISAGIHLAPSPEQADVILVNTCSFIGDAKQESIDAILDACGEKKAGRCKAVIVAGCLPQRYRGSLAVAIPEVDAFIGLDQLNELPGLIRKLVSGRKYQAVNVSDESTRLFEPASRSVSFTGGPHAFVKIAEGCNHRCGFCIIPKIRGPYRSRRISDIVRQSERLLESGIRELDLISQDTTSYGSDLKDGSDLPALLRALGKIGGDFWVRLLYGHPAHVSYHLLDTIAEVKQVCKYLDLPIQHSHPEMLRAMLRPTGSRSGVRSLPSRIRKMIPEVTLRTTCLVGYPGETNAHFLDLLGFVCEAEFDHLGVFAFSREEGTRAFGLPCQVCKRTASLRRDQIMRAQQRIVIEKASKLVGCKEVILVEKPESVRKGASKRWIGRSVRHAPGIDGEVRVVEMPPGNHAGKFVVAKYIAVDGYDLRAAYVGGA